MDAPERYVVLSTAPDRAVAEELAEQLVGAGLAACVNVLPGVTSVYRWRGRIERAGEAMLVIKTDRAHLERLVEGVLERHPYECPEVLALPIAAGAPAYLAWLDACLAAAPGGAAS